MSGLWPFLRKEALEILRTWRIWVLPGVLLFMGLSSPILASVMPEVMKSVTAQQPGIQVQLPPPTFTDAYGQWVKNLSQLVLWVVIISGGGIVSAEHRSGTAILALTKPLSRAAFVLGRTASSVVLLGVSALAGAALCFAATALLFPGAPAAPLPQATLAWLAAAVMVTCVMALASAVVESQAGAAGIGFSVLGVLYFSGLWSPLARFGPVALLSAPDEFIAGKAPELGWPLVTAAGLAVTCVAAAIAWYSRKEL